MTMRNGLHYINDDQRVACSDPANCPVCKGAQRVKLTLTSSEMCELDNCVEEVDIDEMPGVELASNLDIMAHNSLHGAGTGTREAVTAFAAILHLAADRIRDLTAE